MKCICSEMHVHYLFHFSLAVHIKSKTNGFTAHSQQSKGNNWAATCDFQQCGILTSVDSDMPVQPPFKLRTSKRCSVSSLTLIESSSV